jgi:hypothetical protein
VDHCRADKLERSYVVNGNLAPVPRTAIIDLADLLTAITSLHQNAAVAWDLFQSTLDHQMIESTQYVIQSNETPPLIAVVIPLDFPGGTRAMLSTDPDPSNKLGVRWSAEAIPRSVRFLSHPPGFNNLEEHQSYLASERRHAAAYAQRRMAEHEERERVAREQRELRARAQQRNMTNEDIELVRRLRIERKLTRSRLRSGTR